MVKKLQALRAKKGFTLVELIVVIAIIGVLAAILVPTMMNVVTKARVSSEDQTAKAVADTVTEWLADLEANSGTIPNDKTKATEITITGIGGSSVSVTATGFKRGKADGKDFLEENFKENYVSNKTGCAKVFIQNRHVVGCVYSDDVDNKTDDLPAITADDFTNGVYKWASASKEGITTDNKLIGTNPKLLYGEPAKP